MLRREYTGNYYLKEAIYYVYEAKRASESVPGVGEKTHLSVLEYNLNQKKNISYELDESELSILSKQYDEIGKPKAFSDRQSMDLKFIPGM